MNSIDKLQKEAISAALNNSWNQAVSLNQEILALNPDDIATLNRLGFAHLQLGEITQAKTTYQQVLKLDKYNPIAQKILDKLTKITNISPIKNGSNPNLSTASFIEEPGKTKTVTLVRPTSSTRIISLIPGSSVKLTTKKKSVGVATLEGDYVGCLPDDIGFRLAKLIKQGYQYESIIKNSEKKNISIFIREISRPVAFSTTSFPPTTNSKTLSNLTQINQSLDDIPIDVTPTGENYSDD